MITRTVSWWAEHSKRAVDVDVDILIPVPNLVSEVELQRQLAEKDEALAEKNPV